MKICFFFVCFIFVSCSFSESQMIGTYTPIDYKNTFDTIWLSSDNLYERRVYDSRNKLVLIMEGKWSIDQDVIQFKSPYFANFDRDVIAFPELLRDTISSGVGYLHRNNGKIEFCIGLYTPDIMENCYQKIN